MGNEELTLIEVFSPQDTFSFEDHKRISPNVKLFQIYWTLRDHGKLVRRGPEFIYSTTNELLVNRYKLAFETTIVNIIVREVTLGPETIIDLRTPGGNERR